MMPAQRQLSGDPIARGNTSDIWPWTETTVVKVLRPEIPAHWAAVEADIVARVHAAGLPVPDTEGVTEVQGRTGIVLERVEGQSMWERMKSNPYEIADLVRVMVELQVRLHETEVPGLPDLVRRLGSKIDEAVQISADERSRAQQMLVGLPAGTSLCHGDFHPANVVLTAAGPVILDWFDAASGHAVADHVRSSLLMRPPEENSWLRGASRELLDTVHDAYISRLVDVGLIDAGAFAPWEAVLAVARLSEPVPSDDLVAIWRAWRSDGPAPSQGMIAGCLAAASARNAPAS
jgi:aminoglycoside phosphotransferase (APT) family kinase protein